MIQIKKITEAGEDLDDVRILFGGYEKELGENLCFQNFAAELKNPLTKYAPPKGLLFIARENDNISGCIALQPLEEGVCEMKRLYVSPCFRGIGIGEKLVALLLEEARKLGYTTMRLDTLSRLQSAIKIYRAFGFTDVSAYYKNPLPGVVYMEIAL
jgi:putative acetyltransferase